MLISDWIIKYHYHDSVIKETCSFKDVFFFIDTLDVQHGVQVS